MAIIYKLDVLQALKEKGFSTHRIRKEKIFSESVLQRLREQQPITFDNLDRLCGLLECQPADLIGYSGNTSAMDEPEPKTGKWIFNKTYYEADECNCSVCGQLMTTAKGNRMNYCPNCGAKMDK